MDGTIIQVGNFTQPAGGGVSQILQIRSGFDWIKTFNYTKYAAGNGAGGTGTVVEGFWQLGMPNGGGIGILKAAGATTLSTLQLAAGNGFTILDSSAQSIGPVIASTGITNATPPVVTVGSTATLATGNVVRITNSTGALNLSGIDYTINVINGTTFGLTYMVAAGVATAANVRLVNYDPLYYPRRRVISAITLGASTVVTMTVTHGYTVGQVVRLNIPASSGTVELNGLAGTVTAVDTVNNTVTLNINSTGFTAFVFPANAAVPFTPAEVVPVGEDTAAALSATPVQNILADATINTGFVGVLLPTGALTVGGVASDVIYWRAGKSFNT